MRLLLAWGGRGWSGPLWPHKDCPEWANNAARRMKDMGVSKERINQVLQEMRNSQIDKATVSFNGIDYRVVLE